MKCEKCKEREATFFYSANLNGNKTQKNLCAECARAEGFGEMLGNAGVFDRAFDSMIDDFFSPARSFMRLPAFDFFGEGLRSIMAPAFPRVHFVLDGGERSAAPARESSEDKIPEDMGEEVRLAREKAALKAQLEDAVKAEDYEQAIVLRDALRKLG
ncbi:MAG: hypothetical protein E7420_02090 [Ruminococcaceae bacterium]|nr:hypothetical protein [Oscillospiraceae bacterium]